MKTSTIPIRLLATLCSVVTALLAWAYSAGGQTEAMSGQSQLDSVVAVVASAQGFPLVAPPDRTFGTYWEVRNSLPCLMAPLPFPPSDPRTVVYAVGGAQFLVDDTAGPLVPPLAAPYAHTALSPADLATIVQAQVQELQDFVIQAQAMELSVQGAWGGTTSELDSGSPPLPPGGTGGSDGSSGGVTYNGRTPTTNDLWLELRSVSAATGTASLVVHPPANVTNGVYDLLYCTNLAPPISWQWLLRTDPGQTNLTVPNAVAVQGFYRLGSPSDLGALDSLGTNFWVAFPRMDGGGGAMSLYIASGVGSMATVTIRGLGITNTLSLAAGTVTNVAITNEAMMTDFDAAEDKGIHITAGQPVSVYGVYYAGAQSAAFTGYPVPLLGTNYCIMARPPCDWYDASEFAIVATADNTTVSITPSVTANLYGHPGFYQTNLMQGQTYQNGGWDSTSDVTGTWISSDKPIAVFAGATIADVPDTGTYAGNPLVQEQLPVDTWGKEALALSLAGRKNGDSYRILAAYSDTVVTISGRVVTIVDESWPWRVTSRTEVVVVTNQAGQFYDIIVDGPVQFQATQPIQVAQFANGTMSDAGVDGDPCEILLAPTGHYLCTNTVYALPNDSITGDFATNFLNIIVAQSAITNTLVDGSVVPATKFVVIGTSGYYGAQVPVMNGVHTVKSPQPVGVEVYGWGYADAYGYFGGIVK